MNVHLYSVSRVCLGHVSCGLRVVAPGTLVAPEPGRGPAGLCVLEWLLRACVPEKGEILCRGVFVFALVKETISELRRVRMSQQLCVAISS